MGPIEYAVNLISMIVEKKYKDQKLAQQITRVASNCHKAGSTKVNDPQNQAIVKIIEEWEKEYKDYKFY
tara:strand:- start:861 stop:1067 length:207 start_codon:yes stop_codon:yes gene_type:complete